MVKETYRFIWRNIEIEAAYDPIAFGGSIAHLEVRSLKPDCAPLPITETGYRSHFHQVGEMKKFEKGVVECVKDWLDAEANSRAWREYIEVSRQAFV